ncbi:hypothetical protein OGAPHI_003589 [Ogataea philodendri]|uniref:Uncharacterized protein n=1 Tax=Ogataea philodendri TaxID=1378263 RepID=A0A9P8T4T6_9ASCO|nr:uncharacterized protein OGAPHI_003589 [Ogataea philodendri]KAH3665405.1 hypothetical protein OGAPHI_003589 [Ogataea philodendri]
MGSKTNSSSDSGLSLLLPNPKYSSSNFSRAFNPPSESKPSSSSSMGFNSVSASKKFLKSPPSLLKCRLLENPASFSFPISFLEFKILCSLTNDDGLLDIVFNLLDSILVPKHPTVVDISSIVGLPLKDELSKPFKLKLSEIDKLSANLSIQGFTLVAIDR